MRRPRAVVCHHRLKIVVPASQAGGAEEPLVVPRPVCVSQTSCGGAVGRRLRVSLTDALRGANGGRWTGRGRFKCAQRENARRSACVARLRWQPALSTERTGANEPAHEHEAPKGSIRSPAGLGERHVAIRRRILAQLLHCMVAGALPCWQVHDLDGVRGEFLRSPSFVDAEDLDLLHDARPPNLLGGHVLCWVGRAASGLTPSGGRVPATSLSLWTQRAQVLMRHFHLGSGH